MLDFYKENILPIDYFQGNLPEARKCCNHKIEKQNIILWPSVFLFAFQRLFLQKET